jgi:hypothetical protein
MLVFCIWTTLLGTLVSIGGDDCLGFHQPGIPLCCELQQAGGVGRADWAWSLLQQV